MLERDSIRLAVSHLDFLWYSLENANAFYLAENLCPLLKVPWRAEERAGYQRWLSAPLQNEENNSLFPCHLLPTSLLLFLTSGMAFEDIVALPQNLKSEPPLALPAGLRSSDAEPWAMNSA